MVSLSRNKPYSFKNKADSAPAVHLRFEVTTFALYYWSRIGLVCWHGIHFGVRLSCRWYIKTVLIAASEELWVRFTGIISEAELEQPLFIKALQSHCRLLALGQNTFQNILSIP